MSLFSDKVIIYKFATSLQKQINVFNKNSITFLKKQPKCQEMSLKRGGHK